MQTGQPADAFAPLQEFLNAGRAALASGDQARAVLFLRLCTVLAPNWGEPYESLGSLVAIIGLDDRGFQLNLRASRLYVSNSNIWSNLAIAAIRRGNKDAVQYASRAVVESPGKPDALDILCGRLKSGQQQLALAWRLVLIEPGNHRRHLNLAVCASAYGSSKTCHFEVAAALVLAPDDFLNWSNGAALIGASQNSANALMSRRAIQIAPDEPAGWANWSLAADKLPDAPPALTRAAVSLALAPALSTTWYNTANILSPSGQAKSAVNCLRRALTLDPDVTVNWHNYLFNLNYLEDIPAEIISAEHIRFGGRFNPRPRPKKHMAGGPIATRPIRVGFVSGDFRRHSVSYFFLPFLAALDPARIESILFANNKNEDEISAELRDRAYDWVSIADCDDQVACDLVRAHKIDVLVDLSGYSSGNRVSILAHRPAAVQATWLGYVATLGIAGIDYRLSDAEADPVDASGRFDRLVLEMLVRIPDGFLVYENDRSVDIGPCPSVQNGYVTFGSFNNLAKMTEEHTDAIAAILQAVPKSRLMLKSIAFDDQYVAKHWLLKFAARGIDAHRLQLMGWVSSDEHLGLYNQVDIGLDTYPYAGTTTTCDAMWMGVPVISRFGDRHAARMGLSLLTRVGLADLAVPTQSDFIAKAVALASAPDRRAMLRQQLRGRMINGPLGDGPRLARHFEMLCQTWLDKVP